jgi:hypothetical protein
MKIVRRNSEAQSDTRAGSVEGSRGRIALSGGFGLSAEPDHFNGIELNGLANLR